MRQSKKLVFHKVGNRLGETARIISVDPLPDAVLEKTYSRPERDEQGLDRWLRAQATGRR